MAEIHLFTPVVDGSADGMIDAAERLMAKIKAGEVIGMALVEVRRGGDVATFYSQSTACYHALNSGCARLADRIARDYD